MQLASLRTRLLYMSVSSVWKWWDSIYIESTSSDKSALTSKDTNVLTSVRTNASTNGQLTVPYYLFWEISYCVTPSSDQGSKESYDPSLTATCFGNFYLDWRIKKLSAFHECFVRSFLCAIDLRYGPCNVWLFMNLRTNRIREWD